MQANQDGESLVRRTPIVDPRSVMLPQDDAWLYDAANEVDPVHS